MKTIYTAGALGLTLLSMLGVLGWILAMAVVILLPGGSLLALAAHHYTKKQISSPAAPAAKPNHKTPMAA